MDLVRGRSLVASSRRHSELVPHVEQTRGRLVDVLPFVVSERLEVGSSRLCQERISDMSFLQEIIVVDNMS